MVTDSWPVRPLLTTKEPEKEVVSPVILLLQTNGGWTVRKKEEADEVTSPTLALTIFHGENGVRREG